jgi:hypothetical protein
MDPGTVVWLPGSGWSQWEENDACQSQYGYGYFECGSQGYMGGTLVYCCF